MTTMIWVYIGYFCICTLATVVVARTLKIHGAVFITGSDKPPTSIVTAKTHLLVVGFYLVCLGMIAFALKYGGADAVDAKSGIELVSTKIGAMIFLIGFMHFSMVGIFAALKKSPKPVYVADNGN